MQTLPNLNPYIKGEPLQPAAVKATARCGPHGPLRPLLARQKTLKSAAPLRSLFADVMREVGAPAPPPLPVAERQDIERAGAALRRQRAAALTGAAAPFTAPLQVARVRTGLRV